MALSTLTGFIGIVDQAFGGHLQHHGETHGRATYITLREGACTPETMGGWYYQIGVQLAAAINTDDQFDLKPLATTKGTKETKWRLSLAADLPRGDGLSNLSVMAAGES